MATYLDNAGVTQILTKIKSLLAKKAEITAIPTKVSQLTNDSHYQTPNDVSTKVSAELGKLDYDFKDEQEGNSFAVNWFLSGITQTDGKIKAEKADFDKAWGNAFQTSVSRGGEAITETQVDSKIRAAVGKITSFEYKIVDSLPAVSDGKKGVIYLVAHSGGTTQNIYDEYIFLPAEGSTAARYEKIGTTDIDLTPYAKKTEIPTKVSQLTNDNGYINAQTSATHVANAINKLDYTDTAEDGKYVSSVSETNGVIKVTRANLPAVGTADTPISNATIESIFTQVFG
jgi:hypothetical protein